MPALVGDNLYIIVGVLIVLLAFSWTRKPLLRVLRAGIRSGSKKKKTSDTAG